VEIPPIQLPIAPIQTAFNPIASVFTNQVEHAAPVAFKDLLSKAAGELNQSQLNASQAATDLATGGPITCMMWFFRWNRRDWHFSMPSRFGTTLGFIPGDCADVDLGSVERHQNHSEDDASVNTFLQQLVHKLKKFGPA